ncbi:MAG: winged helix DNA-binding domain-containing protein, partial [Myxococcales bacterium]|nr:winged helix DNA-binding domain-containing protein [Myxococcales bacterium]
KAATKPAKAVTKAVTKAATKAVTTRSSAPAKTPTQTATRAAKATLRIPLEQARALWCRKQGLTRPASSGGLDHAALLESHGCLRTLGGVDVYFAIRARAPGATRASIDAACEAGAIRVTPAARGCIYLAPARHVADYMALAAALQRPRTDRDLARAGATRDEVDVLAATALEVITRRGAPLTTAELRAALPASALRSLGDAGKRVGLSSLLPVALRELEFTGRIERALAGGRLDTERYLWRPAARAVGALDVGDLALPLAAIAHRCLEWFAPITVKQLATWIGVSQRDIKAALAGMQVLPVTIEGHADEAWLLARDLDELVELREAPPREYLFLPFADTLLAIHDGPAVHVDPAHHGVRVKTWGGRGKEEPLGAVNHLGHRPLLLGDRMVGLWEYSPRTQTVVARLFDGAPPRGTKAALATGCQQLAAFIRDELEHARSFSLDTDERVQARADELSA